MLGTAGTIAAEIFVLTGHVAGMSGPAGLLALLLVGVLNYAFALNYAELATTYPVTGGAMIYVQEAFGSGLRAFLVGSLDSLSSAFYAALSAVGFAYSLRVFLPFVPVVPTGVFAELRSGDYQLVVMGAAVAVSLHTGLFGEMTDHLAEAIPCSVLLVRRYEPAAITWVRRRVKEVTEPAVAPSGNHRGQNGGTAYAAEDDGYPKIAIHSQ